MLKHIVIWKLKEESNTKEVKAKIKSELEGLKSEIAEIVSISVIIDLETTSTHDVALISEFADAAALETYAKHPKHVYVAETFIKPFVESRVCVDYNY